MKATSHESAPPDGGLWHEFASLFPMMDGKALADLTEDIRAHGVREPVVFFEGKVLDGRNRYMAARGLGLEYPRAEFEGDRDAALAFVISTNLHRRHLTDSQRAMVANRMAQLPKGRPVEAADDKSADLRVFPTQAEAAAALNTSERLVQVARAVERDAAPEIVAMVEAGAVTLNAAAEAAKLPVEEQIEAAAAGPEAVKEVAKRSRAGSIGTRAAPIAERGDDLYQTPDEAIQCLMMLERFSGTVWEPAVGPGAIARAMHAKGHDIVASDIRDHGWPGQVVEDFLTIRDLAPGSDIVTNPPYMIADEFARRAVLDFNAPKVALLLRLQFLAGCNDVRSSIMDAPRKPARVHVFTRRLPMMHRDGWDGPKASSQQDHAWFVWDRTSHGPTIINRVDWKALLA
jgi:ParB-like chromosome segregation protein Spo0J